MEVHAHTHTARKKWTHYFWEFLMLFLAVFCGFLAENQREHMVEHQREKKYIKNLLQDLSRDTSNLNSSYQLRLNREKQAKELILLLNSPDRNKHLEDIYYYGRLMSTLNVIFTPSDATLKQLKNSGALRLINKEKIADSVVAYDVAVERFVSAQQAEINTKNDYRNAAGNVFDATVFLSMIDPGADNYDRSIIRAPVLKPLITEDKQAINHLCTLVHFIYSHNVLSRVALKNLKEQATGLIVLLKQEYHIK